METPDSFKKYVGEYNRPKVHGMQLLEVWIGNRKSRSDIHCFPDRQMAIYRRRSHYFRRRPVSCHILYQSECPIFSHG